MAARKKKATKKKATKKKAGKKKATKKKARKKKANIARHMPSTRGGSTKQQSSSCSAQHIFFGHVPPVRRLRLDLASPWRYPPYNGFLQRLLVAPLVYPYPALRKRQLKWLLALLLYILARRRGLVALVRRAVVPLLELL